MSPGAALRRAGRLSLERYHQASIASTLGLVLAAGLVAVVAGGILLSWRTATDAADAAYDRSLLGVIKAIDANVSTASGGLGVELPYTLLEVFQLTADGGQVFYRIATEDGLVVIGDAELAPPAEPLRTGVPQFTNSRYFGTPVRVGSYARPLDRAFTGAGAGQRLVIQVAESLTTRERFIRHLVVQALVRDVLLSAVALSLLVLALRWALQPLIRLSQEVAERMPSDLTPIPTRGLPQDVQPLVQAINQHMARNLALSDAQRRFVDDASHQLRTPLTVLATQLAYAQRQDDPAAQREVLQALREQLDETIRHTNQMLALARSDAAELRPRVLDLAALAGDLARRGWREANLRGLDLGLEVPGAPVPVQADPDLLLEALSNLLHNAMRHAPPGSALTVRVHHDPVSALAWAEVVDQGPGVPPEELARAGERFFRASNARLPGSGLGLAIARSVVERHHGRLVLANRDPGPGFCARLELPAAEAPFAPAPP
ncbi:sensor histidine kinase [Ideonella livida]|uniref:histidine kinase n=1 Tax=Ideonella livida TaxID=2707176 RepID=A0A7C9TGT0_9BURK|nr:sensor histidine kinase [Ideonella livida]NDY90019.1 sensor histidine kinase [Ideonella livida]